MWTFFHKLGSPPHFYRIAGYWTPWLGLLSLGLLLAGLYGALITSPPDYQQGESVRIIYVHVPAAWMSMFVYVFMAVSAAIGLIWRIKLSEILAVCSAPIGATFTALALITGSLWGKPMWGTYWAWDARLTSELLLLFLYLGYIALNGAFEDRRTGARASAILAVVGIINIPIIHYSVEWWHSLHQSATVTKLDKPSIQTSMLIPLLLMALAYQVFFFYALLTRARTEVLTRESNKKWVKEVLIKS